MKIYYLVPDKKMDFGFKVFDEAGVEQSRYNNPADCLGHEIVFETGCLPMQVYVTLKFPAIQCDNIDDMKEIIMRNNTFDEYDKKDTRPPVKIDPPIHHI